MANTIVNSDPKQPYVFFNDKVSIKVPTGFIEISASDAIQKNISSKKDRVLRLISDSHKLVTTMHPSFYHFCMDFVGKFASQLSLDPDIELIIHDQSPRDINVPRFNPFSSFLDVLDAKGIKYQIYDFSKYDVLEIDNVYLSGMYGPINDHTTAVFDFFSGYIRDKNIKPFRDIFLSRRHMGDRYYPHTPEWAWANNDNRIDNHDNIENYFRSIGYEIVIPENLNSFEEQINMFYEARTIVSTTSSGLTNAIFMQPGQTVIELVTPLIIHFPNPDSDSVEKWKLQEELHHFYSMIAFHKNHNFLALGNKYRKSKDIAKQIEEDKFLKLFINRK